MELSREQRKHPRYNSEFDMRIYTSIKRGAYSVKVTDIARGGAFIKTKFLPNVGEIISYELFDSSYRPVKMGNARVCRVKGNATRDEQGFAIMFDTELNDELLNKFTTIQ